MRIQIKDSVKTYIKGHQERLLSPPETIQNAMLALSKLTPPFSVKLERLDLLDRIEIPVFTCGVDGKTNNSYKWVLFKQTYGKGIDLWQAQASALMELIERFSCDVYLRKESNFKVKCYSEIKKRKVALKHFVPSLDSIYKKESNILDELRKIPLRWVNSFSLTENKSIFLPLHWFLEIHGTNGFAAGNSIEEAILHGLCEVIERHVVSIINQKKLLTPTIDIDSVENHIAKNLIRRFHRAGIKLYIKDFFLNFRIPTIAVLTHDSKTSVRPARLIPTAGTSPNRDIALIRALIEAAQVRSGVLFKKKSPHNFCFPNYGKLINFKYLINNDRIINFSNIPTYSNRNIKNEIELVTKELAKYGLNVIITNVTHNILKVPVVIVTILGAQCSAFGADPYLIISKRYGQLKKYKKCVRILKNYFKLNLEKKKDAKELYTYGLYYAKLKNYTQAIKIFKEALHYCNKNNKATWKKIHRAIAHCYLILLWNDRIFRTFKSRNFPSTM